MNKNTNAFKLRFEAWKRGEPVYENGRVLPHFLGGKDRLDDEALYELFLSTLPDNQRMLGIQYNMRRAWELYNRPKNLLLGLINGLFSLEEDGVHASSIGYNKDTGYYEFLKANNHPTHWMELNGYNNNKLFKSDYEYKRSNSPYIPDKYVPRKKIKMLRGGSDGLNDVADGKTNVTGWGWNGVWTTTEPKEKLFPVLTTESLAPVKAAMKSGIYLTAGQKATVPGKSRPAGSINNAYDKELAWYGLSNGLGQMTNITDAGRYTPQFGEQMGQLYEQMAQAGTAAMLPASLAGAGNPMLDAAMVSAFGAHGLNHAVNEGISGLADAALTTLEVAPLLSVSRNVYKNVQNVVTKGIKNQPFFRKIYPKQHNYKYYTSKEFTKNEERELSWRQDKVKAASNRNYVVIRVPVDLKKPSSVFEEIELPINARIGDQNVAGTTRTKIFSIERKLIPRFGSISTDYGGEYRWAARLLRTPSEFSLLRGKDFVFPIANNEEFNSTLAEHLHNVELIAEAPVVGSSRLISRGYFGGVPGDVEIVVPRQFYDYTAQKLGFVPIRSTANNTGVTGKSPVVMTTTEPNNLDINILDNGYGTIMHQLQSTRDPEGVARIYTEDAKRIADLIDKESYRLNPPKYPISANLLIADPTAQQMFNIIKNDEKLLNLTVIDNLFKSAKKKHFQRAYVVMNDPNYAQETATAIDHMYKLVPGAEKFSQRFKIDFSNIEQNKEILDKIGFLPLDESFVKNQDLMRNILDYWYLRNTVASRSANYKRGPKIHSPLISSFRSFDDIMFPVSQLGNGSSAGGGGNTTLGSTFGGLFRDFTSYAQYHPAIAKGSSFFDVWNAFQKEQQVFQNNDVVRNAVYNVADRLGIDKSIFHNFNSRFTDDIYNYVKAGKISPEDGDYFITRVAKELGVSGFRGDLYMDRGKYFGTLVKPTIRNVGDEPIPFAIRRLDDGNHNNPVLPAEFGTDDMFFKPTHSGIDEDVDMFMRLHGTPVYSGSSILIEQAERMYPKNIADLRPAIKAYDDYLARSAPHSSGGINLNKGGDYKFFEDYFNLSEVRNAIAEKTAHFNRRVRDYQELYEKMLKLRQAMEDLLSVSKNIGKSVVAGAALGALYRYMAEHRKSGRKNNIFNKNTEK